MTKLFIERSDIQWEIIDKIFDENRNRRLCLFQGEYGFGKTTLISFMKKKMENKLVLDMDYAKCVYSREYRLYDIMLDFIGQKILKFDKFNLNPIDFFDELFKAADLSMFFDKNTFSPSLTFSPYKAMRGVIDEIINHYENAIEDADFELAPRVFSRLIIELVKKTEQTLYISIDEVQNLDMKSLHLITKLLESNIKIALIASVDNKNSDNYMNNFHNVVKQHFISSDTYKNFEIRLLRFSLEDTKKYICGRIESIESIDEDYIRKIYDYTEGMPLLLSAVCEDFNQDISRLNNNDFTFNDKIKLYCADLLHTLSTSQKKIIDLIAINQNELHIEVLETLMIEEKLENDLHKEINYLHKKNILEFNNEIIVIRNKILFDYINLINIDQSPFFFRKDYKRLYDAYLDLEDYNERTHKFYSLNNICRKLSKHIDANKYLIICLNNFIESGGILRAIELCKTQLELYANDMTIYEKSYLKYLLVKYYYLSRDNDSAVSIFTNLTIEELDSLEVEEVIANLYIYASKSYYYNNEGVFAIQTIDDGLNYCASDSPHYLIINRLKVAALDLEGKYEEASTIYKELLDLVEAQNDIKNICNLKMTIQMISNNTNQCLDFLRNSLALTSGNNISSVTKIKILNNLGIEHLMNGDCDMAYKHLISAKKEMSSNFFLENHFIENNLGIYYALKESSNYKKSKEALSNAIKYSISPLQKTYTNMNMAILYCINRQYEIGITYFDKSLKYIVDTPDPIVKSYLYFNLAYYYCLTDEIDLSKKYLLESLENLKKPQISLLYDKREKLAHKLGLSINQNFDSGIINTRRLFFAQSDWDFGELMFYD